MEGILNILVNGSQPKFMFKWKMTSIFCEWKKTSVLLLGNLVKDLLRNVKIDECPFNPFNRPFLQLLIVVLKSTITPLKLFIYNQILAKSTIYNYSIPPPTPERA